jgi:uncharacterized membrane protein YhaH (DUF805 family)
MTRYLSFSRMATRSEYWAVLIIGWALAMLLSIATVSFVTVTESFLVFDGAVAFVSVLIMLLGFFLLVWAMLAVTASRCRDAGINPWWTVATIIPYVGFVTVIVLGCLKTHDFPTSET